MKFKDIEEGKLYQYKDFTNVYTKLNGLLYNIGHLNAGDVFLVNMYYVKYTPEFILGVEFTEIGLRRV